MIGSITCDTPVSEIISEDDVSGYLSSIEETMNSHVSSLETTIRHEQSSGGISDRGFAIDDGALLSDLGDNIINEINLSNKIDDYKNSILERLQTQRKRELETLRDKINEKLSELKQEYYSIAAQLNSYSPDNIPSNISEINAALRSLQSEIEKYEEKLVTVEGMM